MGFNRTFEELDRSDSAYFDQLVMEDTNLLGIIDAINVLTLPDQTKALVDMLALKTGHLTDCIRRTVVSARKASWTWGHSGRSSRHS